MILKTIHPAIRHNLILLLLFSGIGVSAQHKAIQPYVAFLQDQEHKKSKDYILDKFKTHDIVILCERDHRDLTQYELIKDILSDDYFKQNVQHLFTEIGVINLQPEITEFLKTRGLDSIDVEHKLAEFQFNSSFWVFWEKYNYNYLLKTIYEINNSSANQISYYPSDVEFDWSQVQTIEDYTREIEVDTEPRDSLIAYNIINQFEKIKTKKNKKALVILNYRHAFKIHTRLKNGELQANAAKYLVDYFGNRATNILISQANFSKKGEEYTFSLIQNGKWDAAFKFLNIVDLGFDFDDGVFGKDNLDIWDINAINTYKDTFDGFVFYKTIEEYDLVSYFNGLIPKEKEEEFFRRFKIYLEYQGNKDLLEKLTDDAFKKTIVKEFTTKRNNQYPNLEELIKSRDKYLLN